MTTLRRHLELETIVLLMIAAAIGLLVTRFNILQPTITTVLAMPDTVINPKTVEIPATKVIFTSQISSDGAKKIAMKTTQNTDNTKTHELSTLDDSGKNQQPFLSKTLDNTKNIVVPFNAWSPDNKYFFINVGNDVMVFKASHAPFADGQTYLDVTNQFRLKNTGNVFNEATGWASETLIIINTTKQNGTKGSSYWFEVPSKAVIQLATEF